MQKSQSKFTILKDEQGHELEQSTEADPMVYLHGHRNMMQGVEEALTGKDEGDELSVTLPPERAYGLVKDDAGQRIPIKHLLTKHKKYKPGMAVKVNTRDGTKDVDASTKLALPRNLHFFLDRRVRVCMINGCVGLCAQGETKQHAAWCACPCASVACTWAHACACSPGTRRPTLHHAGPYARYRPT